MKVRGPSREGLEVTVGLKRLWETRSRSSAGLMAVLGQVLHLQRGHLSLVLDV
jgi:hypothetical protein